MIRISFSSTTNATELPTSSFQKFWAERHEERYRAAPLLRRETSLEAFEGDVATADLTVSPSAARQRKRLGIAEIQRKLARQARVRYRDARCGTSLGGSTEDIRAVVGEPTRCRSSRGVPRSTRC